MKTTMAILLLATITNVQALSFQTTVGKQLDNDSNNQTERAEVVWNDIKIQGSYLTALLEEEIDDLSLFDQADLAKERAVRICNWTGFETLKGYRLQKKHQIFRYETKWYLLKESSGDAPSWEDLDVVNVAPNTQTITGSFINNLVKMSSDQNVTLRAGSPASFSSIRCSR